MLHTTQQRKQGMKVVDMSKAIGLDVHTMTKKSWSCIHLMKNMQTTAGTSYVYVSNTDSSPYQECRAKIPGMTLLLKGTALL